MACKDMRAALSRLARLAALLQAGLLTYLDMADPEYVLFDKMVASELAEAIRKLGDPRSE